MQATVGHHNGNLDWSHFPLNLPILATGLALDLGSSALAEAAAAFTRTAAMGIMDAMAGRREAIGKRDVALAAALSLLGLLLMYWVASRLSKAKATGFRSTGGRSSLPVSASRLAGAGD